MDSGAASHVFAAPHFRADLTQFNWHRITLAGRIEDDHFRNAFSRIFCEDIEIGRSIDDDSLGFQSRSGCSHLGCIASVTLNFNFKRRLGNIQSVVFYLMEIDLSNLICKWILIKEALR